jgi:hypothetical protein
VRIDKKEGIIDGNSYKPLGGLKMMPFEEFPQKLKPNVLKAEWKVNFGKEEKSILEKFSRLAILDGKRDRTDKEKLSEHPIVIYYPKNF